MGSISGCTIKAADVKGEVSLMGQNKERLDMIGDLFFWLGVLFAVAAFTVVGASNTEAISRLEHGTVPLSWLLAGLAIVALMIAEYFKCAAMNESSDAAPAREPQTLETAESGARIDIETRAVHHTH